MYSGEVQRSGHLSRLRMATVQEHLPTAILARVLEEIDTQHRLTEFVTMLEMCVSFLSSPAGSSVPHDTGLRSYAVNVLLIEPAEWDKV